MISQHDRISHMTHTTDCVGTCLLERGHVKIVSIVVPILAPGSNGVETLSCGEAH